MKLAMHVDGPQVRGSEQQALLIARGLRDLGWEVAASCRSGGPVQGAFEALGVRTTGTRPRGDVDAVSAAAFAAWLRRERPDAVLLTSWKRAWVASLAARAARVPRVVLRVGGAQRVPPGVRGWMYRRALCRQIDHLVVNTRELADLFRRQAPGLSALAVVENAVEPGAAAPAPVRAEVGAAADDLLLLGVGVLERQKGYDLVLDALARLDDPRVRLLLAGGGCDHDALARQARELGLADRVHFLGWRRDVRALLAAADGFVHASRSDSLANAMLEAMAVGRPVLATRVPGAETALAARDGRPPAGWTVRCGDADDVEQGLREMVDALRNRPDEARARAAEALWRAEHWFGPLRMAREYAAVLAPGGGR